MKSGRSQGLPFQGDIKGVIGKDRFLVVVALVQSYAASAPDIYGWYDFYLEPPVSALLRNYSIAEREETMCFMYIDNLSVETYNGQNDQSCRCYVY